MNDDNGPDIVIKRDDEGSWQEYSKEHNKHAIGIFNYYSKVTSATLCLFTTDVRLLCKLRVVGCYIVRTHPTNLHNVINSIDSETSSGND